MKKDTLNFIVRTAVLLAVTLLFQMLRYVVAIPSEMSSYLIGSLVFVSLFVAAGTVGILGAGIISVLAPLMAFLQGHAVLPMVIPIALGNIVYVIAAYFAVKSGKYYIVVPGIALKYVVIALGMALFVLTANPARFEVAFTRQVVQLVTGVIGTVIGIPVLSGVRRAIKAR